MSMHNSFLLGQDEGGEYTMSMAYLLAWQGPVLESQDHMGTEFRRTALRPAYMYRRFRSFPPRITRPLNGPCT